MPSLPARRILVGMMIGVAGVAVGIAIIFIVFTAVIGMRTLRMIASGMVVHGVP